MNAIPSRAPAAGAAAGFHSVSRTHVGLVRAINEDRVLDCADVGLWAVADGMGGHLGGDLAAQTVIDCLRALMETGRRIAPADVATALLAANTAILQRNRALGQDAGTTVVVALAIGVQVRLFWAGDSRAYRLRGNHAELLTRDHSVVQELVDAGVLTAEMAERHPQANVVTRALGIDEGIELDSMTASFGPEDRLLLCSDGLSRSLDAGAVDHGGTIERTADRLLKAALDRDGSDNISLVIAER